MRVGSSAKVGSGPIPAKKRAPKDSLDQKDRALAWAYRKVLLAAKDIDEAREYLRGRAAGDVTDAAVEASIRKTVAEIPADHVIWAAKMKSPSANSWTDLVLGPTQAPIMSPTSGADMMKHKSAWAREWARVQATRRIIGRHRAEAYPGETAFKSADYEWRNVVERLMLTLGQVRGSKYKDQVYKTAENAPAAWATMSQEIDAKKIKFDASTATVVEEIEKIMIDFIKDNDGDIHADVDVRVSGQSLLHGDDWLVSFTPQRLQVLTSRLASNGHGPDAWPYVIATAWARYESCAARGQHWNWPFAWHNNLYENFGYRTECFSSPFNSQLLVAESCGGAALVGPVRFCSLFADTDGPFGSLGPIDDLTVHRMQPDGLGRINITVNPPYIVSIMDMMTHKIAGWLEAAADAGLSLRVFTGFPSWRDTYFYKTLAGHDGGPLAKYVKYSKLLGHGDFYYENSNRDPGALGPNVIIIKASWDTVCLANFDEPKGFSYEKNIINKLKPGPVYASAIYRLNLRISNGKK
jgi:Phosphorylated CTD interacting factor 1 WW domain